jgi:hypothetical protein
MAMPSGGGSANPSSALEKLGAVISAVGGQVPWIIALAGCRVCSLYQPAVYREKLFFLLAPIMVGIFASWAILEYREKGMWVTSGAFVVLIVIVYLGYTMLPVVSEWNSVNWVLSYCAVALVVACLYGLALRLLA